MKKKQSEYPGLQGKCPKCGCEGSLVNTKGTYPGKWEGWCNECGYKGTPLEFGVDVESAFFKESEAKSYQDYLSGDGDW